MRCVAAIVFVAVGAQLASGAIVFNVPSETSEGDQWGEVFSIPITLTNTGITNPEAVAAGATSVWGLSFWILANEPTAGAVLLTGRVFNPSAIIVDPTTANAAIPLPLTLQTTRNARDLGSTGSVEPLPVGSTLYMTLTFDTVRDTDMGKISIVQASYNDELGNNWPFDAGSNFDIITGIPEPASLALLGGGVCCLLARGRRKVNC